MSENPKSDELDREPKFRQLAELNGDVGDKEKGEPIGSSTPGRGFHPSPATLPQVFPERGRQAHRFPMEARPAVIARHGRTELRLWRHADRLRARARFLIPIATP